MNHALEIRGFTLLEVMLTMAIIAIVALVASPLYGRFLYAQEVSVVEDELAGSIAKARLYCMLGKNDAQWGVALQNTRIIFFQGNSFADRNTDFDEVFDILGMVHVTGFTEVVCSQGTGMLNVTPTITISGGGIIDTFTLNTEGILEQQ